MKSIASKTQGLLDSCADTVLYVCMLCVCSVTNVFTDIFRIVTSSFFLLSPFQTMAFWHSDGERDRKGRWDHNEHHFVIGDIPIEQTTYNELAEEQRQQQQKYASEKAIESASKEQTNATCAPIVESVSVQVIPGQKKGGRTAFYNTREGAKIIDTARADLHVRPKPIDDTTQKSSVQDNRQRAYHHDCTIPSSMLTRPVEKIGEFQSYPSEEYRFTGRFASTVYRPRYVVKSPSKAAPVQRRHEMWRNLVKPSISNYDHGLPFLAKHTNS